MIKKTLTAAAALLLIAGLNTTATAGSCGSSAKETKAVQASAEKKMDIVETAVAAGDFTTLVAAVKAAGLVDALKGDGPLTVFAPTDEAFAKLPEGTVEGLLKDKEALTAILTYHVVSGKVLAKDVVQLDKAETLNGQSVSIKTADEMVMIDNAQVVKADIMTSNGVIHVINEVILPDMEEK
ncbi:fasciclin domain-containing protein [candidate division GN15 bacterium]|nr:fasciclin domain-containing protein [candidate division GN15 bacterium]